MDAALFKIFWSTFMSKPEQPSYMLLVFRGTLVLWECSLKELLCLNL
jgi:hypothetical protein